MIKNDEIGPNHEMLRNNYEKLLEEKKEYESIIKHKNEMIQNLNE